MFTTMYSHGFIPDNEKVISCSLLLERQTFLLKVNANIGYI